MLCLFESTYRLSSCITQFSILFADFVRVWQKSKTVTRRVSPLEDAELHIRSQRDKDGFEKKYINSTVGW